MDAYNEAHLFVSAVRVCEYKTGGSPSLEEVCDLLGYSVEHGHVVCRDLAKKNIVATVDTPFSVKVLIADHLGIEDLSREDKPESSLERELEEFKSKKRDMDAEVAAIQAEIDKKKKDMFADLEEKFKQEMKKRE